MKKLLYMTVLLAVTLASLTGCKPKPKIASAAEIAKISHEHLQAGNYDIFVNDCIAYDKNAPVEAIRTEKANNVRILKTNAKTAIHKNGGIKNVTIKSEKIAPDGRSAEVVLTNRYHNGANDDVVYSMTLNDNNQWKVKMGHDRQIWKTVNTDGTSKVFKLKEDNTDTQFRDVWKEKEKDVVGVDKGTVGSNVKNVVGSSIATVRKVVKDKGNARREVVKLKEGANKEVIKVKETSRGEVIKIKEDGHKEVIRESQHKDLAAAEAEAEREIERIREVPAKAMYDGNVSYMNNIKDIRQRGNRKIVEVKNDGRKTILKEAHTDTKDIVKFKEVDGHKGFVKMKSDGNRQVYKEKFDGKKSFVKVIDRKDNILVKTLNDGHRETEKIKK